MQRILNSLAPAIDAGVPIVVLEPSCASVFRDELHNLFPDYCARHSPARPDIPSRRIHRAPRGEIQSTAAFAESFAAWPLPSEIADEDEGRGIRAPQNGRGLANRSTPAAAAWPARSDSRRKNTMCRRPSASACCCPPFAHADADTLIVSDGFSCREQIFQATRKKAIHLAEAIFMAASE